VHIDRKLHFSSQGNTAPRKAGSIGLFDSQAQVRGFDLVGHFVAQRWKQLTNHIVSGESLPVLHFEEFFPNRALRIDKEIPGPRHALVLSDRLGVQDLIASNGFRIRIGEQRKLNLSPVREVLQDCLAVIADGRQFDPLFFKSCFRVLQLDQLPLAVGSPVGGTEKKENCAVRALQRIEALHLAKLVASRESRSLLTDR